MRYGAAGYGVFFMIVERLREEADYMSVKDYNMIAFDLRVDASLVKSVIEDFGLFVFTDDGKYFYSESLRDRMLIKDEKRKARSDAGKKGMEKRWGNNKTPEKDNNVITKPPEKDNKKRKEKKSIIYPPYSFPPEVKAVDADDKERIVSEFFSKQIAIEAFCKNNGTTPEELHALVNEILTEWELSNEKDVNERHLMNSLRIKIRLKKKIEDSNDTKSQDRYSKRRGADSAARSAEDYTDSI